jgi:uncharacterized protein YbjT (DUF2867 family)
MNVELNRKDARMRIAVAGGTGAVGRHVVEVARERGHDVVILSRSAGVDLMSDTGLTRAIEGTAAVIDVAAVATQSAKKSIEFFETTTTNLLAAEQAAGVPHHLALSIVGSDRAPFGYYAGKQRQEQVVSAGPVPWTILRATQFHEFAQQLYGQVRFGSITVVPKMTSRPVAAREVGERLVTLAEGRPAARPADLAGPEQLRMADMVRAYAEAIGDKGPVLEVPLPGGFGTALRDGTILPGPSADHGVQTYADWVAAVRRP